MVTVPIESPTYLNQCTKLWTDRIAAADRCEELINFGDRTTTVVGCKLKMIVYSIRKRFD